MVGLGEVGEDGLAEFFVGCVREVEGLGAVGVGFEGADAVTDYGVGVEVLWEYQWLFLWGERHRGLQRGRRRRGTFRRLLGVTFCLFGRSWRSVACGFCGWCQLTAGVVDMVPGVGRGLA